ncbi:MAG: hypothetical protein RMY64_31030 [Nostoc sp. DedQUE08]|uniref:hypothetical protein n=1 Tax=unclassified Nostoc TaxID=2593658 RepID=UPI002AD38068|nr:MULTISPECIES: hypothetical protein [unclassified Nostoc]MDZ8069992.1 hypothetical protein [Nostoc sp. DedQUE08]MDZ8090404.1 hypothetical protein [Nostoc sp. DedQUE05]
MTDKYKCGYKHDEPEKVQQFLKDKSCQKGIEIMHIPIKFPRGKINPPLSWQLTQEQKEAIQNAWEDWKITNFNYISQLKKIFPE